MKKSNTIRWTARIIALIVMLFGLPFYFGYGNPLPFINTSYTLWDNLWLMIFPFMFIGLGVGWKWEKIGGYLVTIPLTLGLLFGLIVEKELIWFMLIPLISGILYLIRAYKK
jgi:hypothetical protein